MQHVGFILCHSAGIPCLQEYDPFLLKNKKKKKRWLKPGHVKWEAEHFTGAKLILTLRLSCLLKFEVLFRRKGGKKRWNGNGEWMERIPLKQTRVLSDRQEVKHRHARWFIYEQKRKKPWCGQLGKGFLCLSVCFLLLCFFSPFFV